VNESQEAAVMPRERTGYQAICQSGRAARALQGRQTEKAVLQHQCAEASKALNSMAGRKEAAIIRKRCSQINGAEGDKLGEALRLQISDASGGLLKMRPKCESFPRRLRSKKIEDTLSAWFNSSQICGREQKAAAQCHGRWTNLKLS